MQRNARVDVIHWVRTCVRRVPRRRGVSSVLAMMFLVLFSSLAVAMAVVSQGNLRTADSARRISRAMSAAETGLNIATRRLEVESKRFVITKGVVDAAYADDLWGGNTSADDGDVVVTDPDGYTESSPPDGILRALYNAHSIEDHYVSGSGETLDIDTDYDTLRVPPINLSDGTDDVFVRIKYEMVYNLPYIRVTAQGVDGDVTRTLQMDFELEKKIEFAVLSPNRIMIGKNVRIEGPLGFRYGVVGDELNNTNGDPLVMRSDFYYLDTSLDSKLDTLYANIEDYDVDGDNRLRMFHTVEKQGIVTGLVDYDQDEYVDDFDLFMEKFDLNADGRVVYDKSLAIAAGLGALTEEFTADDQLARLIDGAIPDRDGDGEETSSDVLMGYRDGVINRYDRYAKVHGTLSFAVEQSDWEAAHGDDFQTIVQGPVRTDIEEPPVAFEVEEDDMLEITTDMLDDQQTWFHDQSFGVAFATQVADGVAAGGTHTVPGTWEAVPYESQGAYDHYQRPLFKDMTFFWPRIPEGTNGLFENCTFIGVTYLETEVDCGHVNWNYAGSLKPDGAGGYEPRFELPAELGGAIIHDTRQHSNNVRFHNCTFVGSISGDKPVEFTHWRNKVQFTGTTKFILDADDPDITGPYTALMQAILGSAYADEMRKSSIMLPGWSVDVGNFTNSAVDPVELKGTIVAGILDARGSVDIFGTLLMTYRPAVLSGPLAYGGQTDAFNTTLGYFGAADGDGEGTGPGSPGFAGFGEITLRYNPDQTLPDGIPWPVRAKPVPSTYFEGGSM